MATTPEAAEAPGGRPPDKPPTPQCLFPPEPKQSQAAAPIDSTVTDNESAPELLATICSVLIPTYTETEVQHRLCPPVSQEVHALWCARNAGWLTQNEFEEAILKFFVNCDAPAALLFADDSATTAALTPRTPSPAGCTPGDLGAQDATASDQGPEFLCVPSPISPDVTGTKVPKTSTTAPPVDQVRAEEDVTIETLPESLKLQGPSRGLCPAQTSGSPMTLKPALAAASASGDVQKLEEVETSPRAFGAPDIAASTPTSKHPKHGKDRRFPDLLRAACHFCDHLPGNTPLQDVVNRFPFHADGRLAVPEHEAAIYLQDLDKNWTPKGLNRRRQGRTRVVSQGAAYLARQTLALLRDSISTEAARTTWEKDMGAVALHAGNSVDNMELSESARDVLLQRCTADRRAAPEWEAIRRERGALEKWLDNATAWQMESRQLHGTCQLPDLRLFQDTAPPAPDLATALQRGGQVKVDWLRQDAQHNGQHGKLLTYVADARRWEVELSTGDKIRVRSANLQALNHLHPMLNTPTALDDPANLWCLPPGPLWWSNAMLELLPAFYLASEERSRAGVPGKLAFRPPTFTLEPGRPPDRRLGKPVSMVSRFDGRRLRTTGDYRSLSPEEQVYLADQQRCYTGFGWPGRDRDRRPAWRPRPPEGFPALDGLLCSASATDIIRCPALIRLMRHQWTPQGWEDPLADHEDSGHDPWAAYGVLEDLDHDCAWAFDDPCFRSA